MFGLKTNNRKKASKEKKVDSTPKYQEDFNEVILNDLVPEERKSEFGLEEVKTESDKKSKGLKLNLGLNGKKSNSKSNSKPKKSPKNSSEVEEKTSKKSKKSKKSSKEVADTESSTKKTKGKKPTKNSKKNKSVQPSQEEVGQEISTPKHNLHDKESSPQPTKPSNKKKKSKISKKEREEEVKVNNIIDSEIENQIIESDDDYVTHDNFDSINFRNPQEVEPKYVEFVEEKKPSKQESSKKRFENIVWSEEKFPKD